MCNTQDLAPLLCVSAVNTLFSVGADRPYRLQQVHWCDTTYWPIACWPLCSAVNHVIFAHHLWGKPRANQSRENFLQSAKYFEGQFSQRCMKSKLLSCDGKGRRTVFHINFSSPPHFSCSAIDFKMRTPVAASLFSWPTKILFCIGFHCSLT